jgi:hypothetical protein
MNDRARAVKAADKAFSLYIRARDPQCVIPNCGKPTVDCSHVFKRDHYSTRWDENNAYGQCRECHCRHHNQSESYLLDYARVLMGKRAYEDMRARWQGMSFFRTWQIEEFAHYYRAKLEGKSA